MTLATTGPQMPASFVGMSREQALAWVSRLYDAQAAGATLWSDAELVARFLQQCSRTGSPETVISYRRDLKVLADWLLLHQPGVSLRSLDPSVAEDALADLRAQVQEGQIKPRTFNRRLACWSSLWRWASEPTRSGATGISRNIWPRRSFLHAPRLAKALAEPELTAILGVVQSAAIAGDRIARRDFVLLRSAYLIGCRVSELANLRWSDVERLDEGGLFTIRNGKGSKSRTVRVSTATVDLIETLGRGEPENWLFPSNRSDGPLSRQAIAGRCRRWGKQAGVHLHPHRLRHTHATHAIRHGVDVFTLQATLGHSSSATTGVYVQRNPHESSSLRLG